MAINVHFSAERWAVQVEKMVRALEVDMKDFLRQELVLLVQKIIEFTPPKSKAQGMQAVRTDIEKVVQPFSVDAFRNPRLKAIVEGHDINAFNAVFSHVNGSMRGATAVDATDIPELHAARRNARGRVTGRFARLFVIGRNDVRFLTDYTEKRKGGNVGMARAGWLPALEVVGGASAVFDVASWTTRHGSEFGSYDMTHFDDPEKPFIDAINSTPWAHRQDEGARIVRNAQDSRAEGLRLRMVFLVRYVREHGELTAA